MSQGFAVCKQPVAAVESAPLGSFLFGAGEPGFFYRMGDDLDERESAALVDEVAGYDI